MTIPKVSNGDRVLVEGIMRDAATLFIEFPGYGSIVGCENFFKRTAPSTEELRAGLLQMMRDSYALINYLHSRADLVFDNSFPWHLVNILGATGRHCRSLLGEHKLSDITNHPRKDAPHG